MKKEFIKIRTKKGFIYNSVLNPAAVYDIKLGLLKIGEKYEIKKYFNELIEKLEEYNIDNMKSYINYIELPRNQELIDKIFQDELYILTYIKNL